MQFPTDFDEPVTLDRRDGPHGEVVLRRHGPLLQIIANGTFLMDTSDGRSERLLVRAALDELRRAHTEPHPGPRPEPRSGPRPDRHPQPRPDPHAQPQPPAHPAPQSRPAAGPRLLIGGLGVGFSLAEAAAEPAWGAITVVEREPAVVDWHRADGPLSGISGEALRDPRTRIVRADLNTLLATAEARFDTLCLDIDNGPEWTVTEDNGSLYSPAGLARCRTALAPGGVLAVWSAQPSPTFGEALQNAGFRRVRTQEIPVTRGVPDAVHFATKPA